MGEMGHGNCKYAETFSHHNLADKKTLGGTTTT